MLSAVRNRAYEMNRSTLLAGHHYTRSHNLVLGEVWTLKDNPLGSQARQHPLSRHLRSDDRKGGLTGSKDHQTECT